MDWADLAKQVIGLGAPLLGGALGGPLGSAAGQILAQALGTAATPEAVNTALTGAPADALHEAEAAWAAALAEIGKAQVAEIGATQRAEMASGDTLQRCWRPLYALELSLLECPLFAATLLHAVWTGHEAGLNGLANLSALLIAYFGARFGVLGVYVTGRSREKQAGLTGDAVPGAIGELIKALAKRK